MRMLLDADMPCHEIGHMQVDTGRVDESGEPVKRLLAYEEAWRIVKGRIMSIILMGEAGGFKLFLTGKGNFREKIATILQYKGSRVHSDRGHVDKLKADIADHYSAEMCEGYEADDGMAIEQWQDMMAIGGVDNPADWDEAEMMGKAHTVIATRDKDLDNVPGWHLNWYVKRSRKHNGDALPEEERELEKGEIYWVSFTDALRHFYKQLLTGDTADDIHGLYNIGPKSAWVKQIDKMDDEDDMYDHVQEKYQKYYRNHWRKWLMENANLLHMWRRKDDQWLPPEERDEDYWK